MKRVDSESHVWRIRALMVVGAMMIALLSWLTTFDELPQVAAPHSLTVVLPFWWIGPIGAYALWPIVFLAWNLPLLAGSRETSVWSGLLAAVALCLSVLRLVVEIFPGAANHGLSPAVLLCGVDLAVGSALLWLYRRGRVTPSSYNSLAFRWVVVAWLAWAGLPWLGEGL